MMPLRSAGMTFSIVARSADGRAHGVAVASKFLAVGAAVPAAEADIGALATQSYANLAYRPQGLALLRTGVAAADPVAGLTAADPDRAVDGRAQPVPELERLLDLHALYFDKPGPATLLGLAGVLADEVRTKLAALGHRDADLDTALASWAGVENLEERLVPGHLDPLVLEHLRGA